MNRLTEQLLSGRFGAGLEIRILMRQTAEVFGEKAPKTAGLSAAGLLKSYAQFTADAAAHALQSGRDLHALDQELYAMAFRLGNRLRRWMAPKNEQECMAVLILLYRNIGIAIREEPVGRICVQQCYFSAFYTPEICSVISAADRGIFAGVCQGGTLSFTERITEGHTVCRADFRRPVRTDGQTVRNS